MNIPVHPFGFQKFQKLRETNFKTLMKIFSLFVLLLVVEQGASVAALNVSFVSPKGTDEPCGFEFKYSILRLWMR